jgi:GTP-binding protein
MKPLESVQFIKSAVKPVQYPQHPFPEIAFIGRSNVGKSSLLNTLVRQKNLAKISNTPGRTQVINFFNIDHTLCFVDLPGYGYAKVPKAVKDAWKPMIEAYLTNNPRLQSVIFILDARHPPSQHDQLMWAWLQAYHIPTILVATKIDKIPKSKRQRQLKLLKTTLDLPEDVRMCPFSALTREGFEDIWKAIWQIATVPSV